MVEITQTKPLTLVLTLKEQDKQILLGWKKRGFGAHMYNGFGGKLEKGETVLQAAHRELEEEAMIKAHHLERVGLNVFTFENDPVALEVHVFIATEYEGTPTETEEMRPKWFTYDSIPYDQMWADDRQWIPHLLNRELFFGEYHFDIAGVSRLL
ncbi:NUDIX hydrolase domain-like protein [Syncephalastrum racemosum]|uniref:Oxidized purine nucleoside triphosphate hydrolase n=1 Tax=Syncephalastrum racemosum TaxID=13706 RepID=A0A1X2HM06_SYNRA|nr:NUDIX hydrolase domain-like protein [Syncephalastrum racemosum]